MTQPRVGILTISDRSSRGERPDASGPLIHAFVIEKLAWIVAVDQIVPDDRSLIRATLIAWCDDLKLNLILTTGGTGFAPRDITPEATRDVIEREAPGLAEAMRADSLQKTPHALLSRAVCGLRGCTLIVNLPGSPKAVRENLAAILPAIPHAIDLLRDAPDTEAGHTRTA
ncbi:MAG: molybdopterin adenylyltransferase [Chloroflexi bacterium]|nr:molybdopterin adenylyltransferase [Chloroflexota bacterium]